MPQTGKIYISVTFLLNHETVLAIHAGAVIIEHPDIFFSLLHYKVFCRLSLPYILCSAKQGRHQCAASACTQSVYSQIQPAFQFTAGFDDIIRLEGFTYHGPVLLAVIKFAFFIAADRLSPA